jgi:predicted nucleic acid-binding protein
MKQRLYIDTSVFGGYFDEEFAEFTKPLFERLQKGEFKLLFSTVTQEELTLAPENVKKLVNNIKNGYKQIEIRSPRDFMTYGDND